MKNGSKKRYLALALSALFLASCSLQVSVHGSYSYLPGTFLEKKDVSSILYHDFFYQSQGGASDSLLSLGNEKCLVLPIGFSDYQWSDKMRSDLAVAFNGKSEDTHYWESVSSFYEKSSFAQLHLSFTVADPYQVSSSAVDFLQKSEDINSSKSAASSVMASAIAAYKTKTGDFCKDFDVNGDGFIDAVYLIYACPDYLSAKNSGLSDLAEREGYWAYTARDASAHANVASPVGRSFTWASYDFLYRGVSQSGDISTVDAHTYIHETGHLLGLDDYYSYTPNESDYANPTYKYEMPTGGLDMMDLNILDHDAWSKFALGWNKPYVITDDLSFPITLELNESQIAGDFILIPAAGESYNGTAFGEYLMIELFTPDGLNKLDATTKYAPAYKYPRGFFMPGVKISHVDARLAHYANRSFDYNVDLSSFKNDIKSSTASSYYRVGASNSANRSSAEGFRLIHLLEADGTFTFGNQDYEKWNKEYFYADNTTLFEAEDERSTFNMSRFSSFFLKQKSETVVRSSGSTTLSHALFNSGKEFPYTIRINGIKGTTVEGETTYRVSLTIAKA
jgi:M6 family metalloprotease-like protein